MQVNLDGSTKIVSADRIKVTAQGVKGAKADTSIDFGRDKILIVCPRTHRALATCTPLAGVGAGPVSTPSPAAPDPDPSPVATGRLTEAHRERLERMWKEHPNWSDGKMGEEFEVATGRPISPITAGKYRPAQLPTRA